MKALKEKRISLRSLLGRSLVILSLFALVFSSCNDSSDDDSAPTASGKVAANIWVKDYPVREQYEGCLIDLTGLVIGVEYTDGTTEEFDGRFATVTPARAFGSFGAIGDVNTWVPYTGYTINFGEATKGLTQSAASWFEIKQIVRTDATFISGIPADVDVGLGRDYPDNYWLANGLQLTGTESMAKKRIYVDESPSFAGLKLEANYVGGDKKEITLQDGDPFFQWIIAPRYNNGNKTGRGDLFITIGEGAGIPAPLGTLYWPITVTQPLDEVYHVTKLEVINDPEINFFYFEDETDPSPTEFWVGKAGNLELQMTYSNDEVRKFTVAQAYRQNDVWWNEPFDTSVGPGWFPPIAIRGVNGNARPPYSTTTTLYARNREPKIYIYYRGYGVYHPVPVLTRLDSLSVTSKSGELIHVDMTQSEIDNDYREPDVWTATRFASEIDVVATFTAYSDSNKRADYPLSFNERRTSHNTTLYAAPAPAPAYQSYRGGFPDPTDVGLYSMDFGKHPWWRLANATTKSPDGDWEEDYSTGVLGDAPVDRITSTLDINAFGVCNAKNNNDRERAVVVYYTAPALTATTGVNRRSINNRISVEWEGIRTRR